MVRQLAKWLRWDVYRMSKPRDYMFLCPIRYHLIHSCAHPMRFGLWHAKPYFHVCAKKISFNILVDFANASRRIDFCRSDESLLCSMNLEINQSLNWHFPTKKKFRFFSQCEKSLAEVQKISTCDVATHAWLKIRSLSRLISSFLAPFLPSNKCV